MAQPTSAGEMNDVTGRDGYRFMGTSSSVDPVTGNTADGGTDTFRISVEIVIEAEPADVFEYVSDLSRSGEWSPECRGGTWLEGGPSVVGSVFRGRNFRSPDVVAWAPVVRGEWTTESQVVECRAPHVFRWAMRDGAGRAQQSVWSFETRPTSGGSVLTHAFWMGELTEGMRGIFSRMDPSGPERFVADWAEKLQHDMRAALRRIKSALESRDR